MEEKIKKSWPKHQSTDPCSKAGCQNFVWSRGYCHSHYNQARKKGLLPTFNYGLSPLERFTQSYEVDLVTGCWNWTGWLHSKGYPYLTIGRRESGGRRGTLP